jgi:organic radical activating enzyme
MNKSKTFCIATHVCMAVQNEVDYCCCNANKESWKTNDHQVMRVNEHSPKQAWNSYSRKIIREVLDNGQQHHSCQKCWDIEAAGSISQRMTLNNMFVDVELLNDQPQIIIIKPGNTCNFACRMCNPETSSSWYSDAYKLEKSTLPFSEYTRKFETIRNSFNRDNENFWNTFKQWLPTIKYIDIYGGEPFLAPALFDLLEHGVNIGAAKEVSLQLHTNASIMNQHYLDILSQYKKVTCKVSIDSSDPKKNDYIRHQGNFDKTIANAKLFKTFFDQHKNLNFGVTYTLTPLNVFHVDQDKELISELLELPKIDVNIVTTPEYDIRHLPIPVKDFLINNINDSSVNNFLKQTIPGCDIEWPKFCKVTDELDAIRNQSFAETFPEWWEMLKPYWVSQ